MNEKAWMRFQNHSRFFLCMNRKMVARFCPEWYDRTIEKMIIPGLLFAQRMSLKRKGADRCGILNSMEMN